MASGDDASGDIGLAETVTPAANEPAKPAPVAVDPIVGKLDRKPDADQLARAVARARIGNKLFAKQERVNLGRYHLLEMVGSGGMGVVWGAWDPELERRVAIKLVKATMKAARDRIQLEGQALAKLSHPNVVTVYDVGVVDEQVYIVMEWVRGQNLRAYCATPRTVKEILAVYRAAGEGLAAAHAAGLIHRDFKPDNAIRGDDGRVRVLDFGLARGDVKPTGDGDATTSTDATRGAGTPRYMPPEQAEGRVLTPAVDQYAFCVSLREALAERTGAEQSADVPNWLDAIATRGTAREPKDRFASMAELLHALGRDPARIWRRRAIVAGAVGAAAAAFAVGNLRAAGSTVEPCSGSRDEIARIWSTAARRQLATHLETLGAYGSSEAPRLDRDLDAYAGRWAASDHAACIAHERGERLGAFYDRNLLCLGRARAAFEQAIELLEHVPAERVSDAIVAARSLPDTERCTTEASASTVEPPRPEIAARATALSNEIAKVRVLAQAADPTAQPGAAAVVKQSEQLGYAPLVARAYLVQGIDFLMRGEEKSWPVPLDHAQMTALDAGDDALFIEAFAREIYGIAITDPARLPPTASAVFGAIPYVERVAQRLGTAASFERPLLLNNVGIVKRSAGDMPAARSYFAKAAEEPRTREGDVELVMALGNLGYVTDDPRERDRRFLQRQKTLQDLLGENHVRTLEAMYASAVYSLENPKLLSERVREICSRYEQFHAAESPGPIGDCEYESGWLAEERGDTDGARTAMSAVAALRIDHDAKVVVQVYLDYLGGKPDAAVLAGARHAWDSLQSQWWLQYYGADALMIAAAVAERTGRIDEALADLRTVLATYGKLDAIKNAPFFQRRLARARARLAGLLATRNPVEARKLAEEAAQWYRHAGGYDERIAALAKLIP